MAFELGDMRDGDAAKGDVIAGLELMHIEALADARGAGRGKQSGQHVEILREGDLGKADGARNELDPRARRFDGGEVINEVRDCGFEGSADSAEAEGLGRLDPVQGAPVHGAERVAALVFERIRNWQGGCGGVVRFEGGDERRDRTRVDAWPGGVMDQDEGVVRRVERPKAAEYGLSARCARFGAGETLAGGRRAEVRSGDNDHVRDGRMAAEGTDGPVDHTPPEQRLPLLGIAGSGPVSLASGDDNGGCTTHRAASSGAGPV